MQGKSSEEDGRYSAQKSVFHIATSLSGNGLRRFQSVSNRHEIDAWPSRSANTAEHGSGVRRPKD
jgi:hypothetical protein